MYSGTTLRSSSGNIIGAHQRIDRIARRHLEPLLPLGIDFPKSRDILHFEGRNGPDGVKAKSPSRDEPWHYIDPADPADTALYAMIDDHLHNLTVALSDDNYERAAFEAAWLSHAMVDGLTPPHYYPLDDKIEQLWGKPKEQRITFKDKNIIIGDGYRDTVVRNWEYWGAKGVFTTHFMFEWGFATTISSLKLDAAKPTSDQLVRVKQDGIAKMYEDNVHHVYDLGMYEEFYRKGWTRHLARLTRTDLAPAIVRSVTLAWYVAACRAADRKLRRR